VLVEFGEDGFAESGDVQNDERFFVLSPLDERVVGRVGEDLVKVRNEGRCLFALVVLHWTHWMGGDKLAR